MTQLEEEAVIAELTSLAQGASVKIRDRRVLVLPRWDSAHKRRSRGGRRFRTTGLPCNECGTDVAVPLKLWQLGVGDHFMLVCEECSIVSAVDQE